MYPTVASIRSWLKHPIRTYKKKQHKRLLYDKMKMQTREAVIVFKPKGPNHSQSVATDMKEWALWMEMRDLILELDEMDKI